MNYMEHRQIRRAYESEEKTFLQMAERYYDPDRNPVIRHLFNQDIKETINNSIDALPDRCREVFRLSYIEGFSHREIARKLSISERTVDSHIYSALRELRTSLSSI